VSFIIPALNEERHIGQCLRAIQNLERPGSVRDIEIIVVDNQSSDRTAEISRGLGARVVEVSPKNPSHARNAGARAATGQWLAFVDADCGLAADWLTICGAHLADPQVVSAAGALRAPERDRTWVERAVYELAGDRRGDDVRSAGWLPTFNLLVRRSAFDAVGGFDESLTTCEDCDLGYKFAPLGKQMLDRRTTAAHYGESRTLGELFRREAWRSRGNLGLALSRPFDTRNWLSLLFPLVFVAGFAAALIAFCASLAMGAAAWPWLFAFVMFPVAVAGLVLRKSGISSVRDVSRQSLVLLTYFAGRAAGLFWPFRRVNR
jgi:glycosyltransferase involved in cell wall biosynthesis